jgi:ankyrin repeat protein
MGNPRYEEEDEEEEEDQANEQMGEILVSQVNLEIDYSASTIPSTSISTTILPMRWSLANALLADDPHAALEQIQRCDQAGRLELVNEHYDDDNIGRDADDASRAERKRKLNEIDQGLREAFWDSQQHTTHGERIDDYPHVVSCYTIVLVVAATFGCTCVVRELLLQSLQTSEETTVVVDIRYMNHLVLKRACLRGHFDVVTLLLADQRVGRRVIIDDLELDAIADKANTQDVVNLLLKDNRLDSISRWNLEFRLCCRAGALDVVESMLGQPHGGDPCADDNLAIRWASETGKLNVVRRLLADRRVDTSECHQSVLECAAIHGQLDIVRLVLQNDRVLHAPDSGETAWKYSCFVGDTDTVEQLLALPDIDPVANNQVVFSVAAQHNRVGVLKCLLQDGRVEPSAMGSLAMRLAFSAGSLGAIELLLLVRMRLVGIVACFRGCHFFPTFIVDVYACI